MQKIAELGLPLTQVTILKHDLHFTHKDEGVLDLMKSHNIYPLFVPAGCTDILQECDTVVNKTFKTGIKSAYRDYLHGDFNDYLTKNPDDPTGSKWNMKYTMGALKPFIVGFVNIGISWLTTPEFKSTIKTAFKNDGLFEEIRARAATFTTGTSDENNVVGNDVVEDGGGNNNNNPASSSTSFDMTLIENFLRQGVELTKNDDDDNDPIAYFSEGEHSGDDDEDD